MMLMMMIQGRRNVSKVGGAISVSVDADPPPMLSGKMLGGLIHKFCRLSRIVGGAIAPPAPPVPAPLHFNIDIVFWPR